MQDTGYAWFVVQAIGIGEITVEAIADGKKRLLQQDAFASINITVVSNVVPVPPVAKLVLEPAKVYRRCNDPLELTVTALNSTGGPVPGVNVSFALFGDCSPDYTSTALTDSTGKARVSVDSKTPGALVVLAAANGPAGIVTSNAAHVFFFEDHGYLDKREREFYGHDHDDRPHGGFHYDDDAWRGDRDDVPHHHDRHPNHQ